MSDRDSVHRIDLPRPTNPPRNSKISADDRLSEPIGVHLVEGERTVLFGTGYAATATQLRRTLSAAPDVVIVEHGDPDHYGAVAALRDAYEDLMVVAPLADRARFSDSDVEIDAFIEHGDSCAGFEAIHVPGHTPGNMSFVDVDQGLLVVGDSFVAADSEIAADGAWSGAFALLEPEYNSDFDELCESIRTLTDYSFDTALLTHGEDYCEDAKREVSKLLADVEKLE